MNKSTDLTRKGLISDRAALVTGLRDLAEFLEAHPNVPVDMARVVAFPDGDQAEAVAAVDVIAVLLGVESGKQNSRSPHHVAGRMFGPVLYEASVCDVYEDEDEQSGGAA